MGDLRRDDRIPKIVSGGQTGVDRGALDFALSHDLPCGGWCPKDRRAEDGSVPSHYPLQESTQRDYSQRTEWNLRDSEATLILTRGKLEGGTALTRRLARKLKRPFFVVDLLAPPLLEVVQTWLREHQVQVLNVAGPRESRNPGIQVEAQRYLEGLFLEALSARTPGEGATS